jgi:hypothetical protein
MTDMPDPFKCADTVADLDSDHLLHLHALNLIQASRDGDDATAWAILALHSGSNEDLASLARSLVRGCARDAQPGGGRAEGACAEGARRVARQDSAVPARRG